MGLTAWKGGTNTWRLFFGIALHKMELIPWAYAVDGNGPALCIGGRLRKQNFDVIRKAQ